MMATSDCYHHPVLRNGLSVKAVEGQGSGQTGLTGIKIKQKSGREMGKFAIIYF